MLADTPLARSSFLLAFVAAAALSFALTPLVRRIAAALGVLDTPDPRKIHVGAVPRWGGAAVGVAVALAITTVMIAKPALRDVLFTGATMTRWSALAIGSLVILITGMIDDA